MLLRFLKNLIYNSVAELRSKSYFDGKTVDLHEMEQCVPPQAEEKQTELFWNNRFYGITFRKSRGG